MKKIFNDVLGEIVFNGAYNAFECTVKWCGSDVDLLISDDTDEELNETIKTATEVVKNQEKWDSETRKFAAQELTELANDWAESPEITEEMFAERIGLCDISFEGNGEFIFWFHDDDMFAGHSVTVCGDIVNGFSEAQIEG